MLNLPHKKIQHNNNNRIHEVSDQPKVQQKHKMNKQITIKHTKMLLIIRHNQNKPQKAKKKLQQDI